MLMVLQTKAQANPKANSNQDYEYHDDNAKQIPLRQAACPFLRLLFLTASDRGALLVNFERGKTRRDYCIIH